MDSSLHSSQMANCHLMPHDAAKILTLFFCLKKIRTILTALLIWVLSEPSKVLQFQSTVKETGKILLPKEYSSYDSSWSQRNSWCNFLDIPQRNKNSKIFRMVKPFFLKVCVSVLVTKPVYLDSPNSCDLEPLLNSLFSIQAGPIIALLRNIPCISGLSQLGSDSAHCYRRYISTRIHTLMF